MKHIYKIVFDDTVGSSFIEDKESSDSIINELRNYAHLEDGWSFGEGRAINTKVIFQAIKVYNIGKYFIEETKVFAGVDGSVLVVFYKDDYSIEISVNPDLSLDIIEEKGIGFEYDVINETKNCKIKCIDKVLNKYTKVEWMGWKLLGSYITDTMTQNRRDSGVQLFKTHQEAEEFPSLTANVLMKSSRDKIKPFATT